MSPPMPGAAPDDQQGETVSEPPVTSVVIATRDRPELLRATIRSVYEQDHTGPVEVVVVFDQAPVDAGLGPEFASFQGPGPRTLTLTSNSHTPGLAGARNTGVEAAAGDVLAFCDDDDTWMPEKLRLQLEKMRDGASDLVVCGIEIDINGQRHHRIPRHGDLTVSELSRRRVMAAHPSTVLITRAGFERVGAVDENIPGGYAEDYDWMLRAIASTKISVVERPLVRVLWHSGSFFTTQWAVIIAALDYMVAKHTSIRDSDKGLARIYGQQAFAHAALGERSSARAKAWQAIRLNPREPRSILALAVSARVLSAPRVVAWANNRGRGI